MTIYTMKVTFLKCHILMFFLFWNVKNIKVDLMREFHNKVPPDKMPLLCRKFCVINKPFTENIVYFCL